MIGYSEAPRAWGYTRGMARVLGLSLTRAVVEGWLTRGELGHLVDACQSCDRTEDCTQWLAHNASAEALPSFCRNGPALAALKP